MPLLFLILLPVICAAVFRLCRYECRNRGLRLVQPSPAEALCPEGPNTDPGELSSCTAPGTGQASVLSDAVSDADCTTAHTAYEPPDISASCADPVCSPFVPSIDLSEADAERMHSEICRLCCAGVQQNGDNIRLHSFLLYLRLIFEAIPLRTSRIEGAAV